MRGAPTGDGDGAEDVPGPQSHDLFHVAPELGSLEQETPPGAAAGGVFVEEHLRFSPTSPLSLTACHSTAQLASRPAKPAFGHRAKRSAHAR